MMRESQAYHQLPFVCASSSSALCWKNPHFLADAPFGDYWVVDGGFNKRKADPVILGCKLQRWDGLRNTLHKTTLKRTETVLQTY